MSVIDTIPTTDVIRPRSTDDFVNGQVPDADLRDPGDGRGPLAQSTSYALQALIIAAAADGVEFGSVGRYRDLKRQEDMFLDRYVPWDTGRPSKVWNGRRYWLKPGAVRSATPGKSNHGFGCADDICEIVNGHIVTITDRGLSWLRQNGGDFGFGLEARDEPWHWHTQFRDTLPERAMQVLAFCGIPWPEWMGTIGDTPGSRAPLTPIHRLPPVDLQHGVYGLVGYAISQMQPLPILAAQERFDDIMDPLHVQFVQSVLRHEVSRFALWFAASGQADSNERLLYLHATHQTASVLPIDGDYGPQTAECVEFSQRAFSLSRYDGHELGFMEPYGIVGPSSWPLYLQSATKEWWKPARVA